MKPVGSDMRTWKFLRYSPKAAAGSPAAAKDIRIVAIVRFFMALLYFIKVKVRNAEMKSQKWNLNGMILL